MQNFRHVEARHCQWAVLFSLRSSTINSIVSLTMSYVGMERYLWECWASAGIPFEFENIVWIYLHARLCVVWCAHSGKLCWEKGIADNFLTTDIQWATQGVLTLLKYCFSKVCEILRSSPRLPRDEVLTIQVSVSRLNQAPNSWLGLSRRRLDSVKTRSVPCTLGRNIRTFNSMNSLLAGFLLWIDTARVIWKERISWGSLSSLLIRLGTELFMPSAQSTNVKTIRSKITILMSKNMLYKSTWKRSISAVSCVFLRDSNRQKKRIDNLPTPKRSVQRQKRSSLPSWCTTSMEMAAYPKRCSRKQSMYWQYIVLLVMKVLLRSCWLCWAWWWGPMSLLANSCQLLIGCYLKPTWIR